MTRHRNGIAGEFSAEQIWIKSIKQIWIKSVQQEQFKSELHDLRTGKTVSLKSKIATLLPMLIDGII